MAGTRNRSDAELHASATNLTIKQKTAAGIKVPANESLADDDIRELLKACGIDPMLVPTPALTNADIAQALSLWLKDNKDRPSVCRMILNTASSTSKSGSHWVVAEFTIGRDSKVHAVNVIDSQEQSRDTANTYKRLIAGALAYIDPPPSALASSVVTEKIGASEVTYTSSSPFIQPDEWSCGYYALMNLINALDEKKSAPAADDISLRSRLRNSHDTAVATTNTTAEAEARLQHANTLRDMCFETLGVNPKTGFAVSSPDGAAAAAAIPATSTATAPVAATVAAPDKPKFQNLHITYTNKSAKNQARELLDAIKAAQAEGYKKVGFTYSANSQQTEAIHRYNNSPTPENLATMKATFQGSAGQGTVVRELFSLVDGIEDEKEKSALLGKIRILPLTTILRDAAGDHPTTNTQLNTDIEHIIDFAENNGCILGWQNEDSGKIEYAIGGKIAGTNFSTQQRSHVQQELLKLHNSIINNQDIQPQELLGESPPQDTPRHSNHDKAASPPAAATASAPPPLETDTNSESDVTQEAPESIADHINAVFEEIAAGNNEFEDALTGIGVAEDQIPLLNKLADDAYRNEDDTKSTQERMFYKFFDLYPKQKLESLNRLLLASINQYVELRLSEHSDKAKLKELEGAIKDIEKQLIDARDTLEALQTHTDKISLGKRKSCETTLSEGVNIATQALSRISNFEQAKEQTNRWLHASILESKASEHDTLESARQEASNLLGSTSTVATGSLSTSDGLQTTGKKNYTVFKMTVQAQDKTIINSAVIRTVDRKNNTIKSEFHFNSEELSTFKNNENVNSAIMEMVAQNIKNFRAPMLATDVNKPIKLNIGNPPMPSTFIKGYIIYCAYKGYELEVSPYSPEYKAYQDNVHKPGWFGSKSKVDSFASAWKIKHPDDVGIKEQQMLDAQYSNHRPS